MHDCEHWPDDADGPDRAAQWHGIAQRAEVARSLGWWTTAVGIDYPVEDYTRVLAAVALRQVTWDRQEQKYIIGDINDDALDRALAG